MSRLTIIVAATVSNGIGKNGTLPWHLPKDLKYFAQATSNAPDGMQNAVIMGRNTWESIPVKHRPLKGRLNVVVSRDPQYKMGVASGVAAKLAGNLQSALNYINGTHPTAKPINRAFIIGGASIINETLDLGSASLVDRVLLTRILSPNFECDTFIPDFLASGQWSRSSDADLKAWVGFDVPEGVQSENDIRYEFQMWTRN